ncbi:peptidylprolyl isomerase [Polyangium sp. 6x1]|uniref:peptidylprolyl isomerase n=1 Tax=Polyangium sp. 6x1 TaxID=3042689 RepID=UPI0024830485|nr:peptidylprolyl isomerase [Polyangium sp. 6x1]MDI1450638.1 peptidylprolyl isomerase [Polyangium sp. 6x1]
MRIPMLSPRSLLLLVPALLLACQDAPPPAPAPATSAAPAATPTPTPSAAPAPTPEKTAAAPEKPPEWITAQHVLVAYKGAKNAPKTVTRSKADAKKRAEEVAAKAKAGEDFTALVKEYSDDAATAERLGSLGKFKADGMVKPFSDAAFALKVDETSGVVETPFGFHVIKRNQ